MITNSSNPLESSYIVRGDVSPGAITKSLQALLPTRHHVIDRHRFTVLDTFDGRLRRTGARLTRAGTNGASTMAWQPRGGGSQLAVRLKQHVGFVWDLPDAHLQQVLAPVVGVRRLLSLAEAEEYGSLLDILNDRGKTVARLRITSGRARAAKPRTAWHPLPIVMTLTGLRGYEGAYERLVPLIESRPGIESCPEGLHGVALHQVGVTESEDLQARVNLVPTVHAEVGARQIHLALLGILGANEPGLRENLDTEFLHDFRVAVRRTRALLGQIRHVFPPDVVAHFATEFSWLGRVTGAPRDLDVLVLALRHHYDDVPAGDLNALTTFLGQAQQQEHARLIEALDTDRYRRLISEWKAFLEGPDPTRPDAHNAGHLLVDVVSPRAWRLSRRIADKRGTIDAQTAPALVHDVRIDTKKLRYLVDVTPAFYGAEDLAGVLGALKKLQSALGDFNDAHVQEERLIECGLAFGAAGGPAGALLALGRLAEQSRQRRERVRGRVMDALEQFCARDTQAACRRAFKDARAAERER